MSGINFINENEYSPKLKFRNNMQKEQTAMQQLIDKIKVAIGDHDLSKTEYGCGYKQCLISLQNDIEIQMLSIEKRQIAKAVNDTYDTCQVLEFGKMPTSIDGENYYEQMYSQPVS